VSNIAARNAVLKPLLENGGATGFVYLGKKGPWTGVEEPAFAGETVSGAWWPQGGEPCMEAGRAGIQQQLKLWRDRLPAILASLQKETAVLPRPVVLPKPALPHQNATVAPDRRQSGRDPRTDRPTAATTPPIPADIRNFRCQPHYTSIFEIYPEEARLYGTEDLYGDWHADVLLMAKDAGSSRNFLPESRGGLGWSWVHNPSRPTNRNLIPLVEQLPCGKLYASFLACLLRNDAQESGNLVMDARIRDFVKRTFLWTVEQMPRLRSVAVLGADAWREIMLAAGNSDEARLWKARHTSGQPVSICFGARTIEFFALNHPARITPDRLMRQAGWKQLLLKHQ
jgi:hypothetical protein